MQATCNLVRDPNHGLLLSFMFWLLRDVLIAEINQNLKEASGKKDSGDSLVRKSHFCYKTEAF